MTAMLKVSHYCMTHSEAIAKEVVASVVSRMELDLPVSEKEHAIHTYTKLMEFFGELLINEEREIVPDSLIEWSQKNSAQALSEGKLSTIVVRYPETRKVFSDILTKMSIEFGLTLEEHAYMIKQINAILDLSLNETVLAFERFSDQYKEETQKELAQLSAPIVPVKDGVIVLPLIGIMNSYRASYIKEKVIPTIGEMQIDIVILDFSGLLTIDEEMIQFLYQIENTMNIMGMDVILTGMHPELTKVAVNAGLNNAEFRTFANVKQALQSIG